MSQQLSELSEYQKSYLMLWTRTQMIEYLMTDGLRGPRRELRNKSTEWLMIGCVEDGALLCNKCLEETSESNPLLDAGLCEECQVKADEHDLSEHDAFYCDCPLHA